jgi:hypothetical protein
MTMDAGASPFDTNSSSWAFGSGELIKRRSTEIVEMMERQNTEFHERMEQHHQAKMTRMDRFLDLYEKDVNSKTNWQLNHSLELFDICDVYISKSFFNFLHCLNII